MRSAYYDRVGPAAEVLRITTLAIPVPKPQEVLVRLHASGVNPSDVKRRAGWRGKTHLERPIIPHSDGAGVVEAVGRDVPATWVGRRVWIWSIPGATFMGDEIEGGTAAEYVSVPLANVAPLPDNTSFETGACLGIPALTAHFAVFSDGPVDGKTVLVQGGGGAVGEFAIQFAKNAGARVIATAGSDATAEIARNAGADLVVDRHDPALATLIAESAPGGIDRIIEVDFAANVALCATVIKPGGVIASYSSTSDPEPRFPYYALQLKGTLLRLISSYILADTARERAIADITEMLERGSLRPTIMTTFALQDIADAHRELELRTVAGQVVVRID